MIREIDSSDYCTLSPMVQAHMRCRYCDSRATHIEINGKRRTIICRDHANKKLIKEAKA